jgi:hypothetical protein
MNLLAAENAIVARLREQIPDVDVGSVAAIAGSLDITSRLPFMFVQPGGSQPSDIRGGGRAALDQQTWVVQVMVGTPPDKRFLDSSYQDAGELLGRVYQALTGWSVGAGSTPFRYQGRPEPHLELGWAAFPIAFDCAVPLINT